MESRNERDITPRYPELHGLIDASEDATLLDGEVVAFDAEGKPSFQRLQERMHVTGEADVRHRMGTTPVGLPAVRPVVAGREFADRTPTASGGRR